MEGFGGLCTYKCMCGDWPTYGAFVLVSESLLGCWVSFLFRDMPKGIRAQCKERKSRGRVYGKWRGFNQSRKKGKKKDCWTCAGGKAQGKGM
jgi:hypothetical protein